MEPTEPPQTTPVERLLRLSLRGSTQEELAECCLQLAQSCSGAELGWVGLLNARRRLDTIAMCTDAWDECEMEGDSARQLLNMRLRGIWSFTLRKHQAEIVNDPNAHLSRVGLPLGHTPIRSFMGVPLLVHGRAIGMIALANRPGGFHQAQLERVEPLATALAIALRNLRTEAELRLQQAIFGAMQEGLALCAPGGVISHANPAFVSMWGYQNEAQVVGWPLLDIAQLEMDADDECYRELLDGELSHTEAMASPEGRPRFPVEITASPVHDEQGQVIAVALAVRDISEQKAMEERMWATTEVLSRSNQELERFAQVAARELRSPLRKVLAYGDFLQSDCGHQLDKVGRDYLGRILESARHQQRMVDGLLRYARIRCSEASFQRVDLSQLLRDVVSDLRPILREVGGSIQIGQGVSLRCDDQLLRMALARLVENGLRYHRPGVQPEVLISTEHQGEWCVIRVRDNGRGFDEGKLHLMFQVFGRLQGQHEQPGTGLGLPVAQRIVEQHGGTITASSTRGQGSEFTLSLPHRLERQPYVASALRTDTFQRDEE
jgi:PAS domain S-box-containing protein